MSESDAGTPPESKPDRTERTVELPQSESTFQEVLLRTFGGDSNPRVQLDADSAEEVASARLAKLRAEGETRQRYVLMGELGRGGMGAVLQIFDTDLRRNLAMKVVLGADDDEGDDGVTALEPQQVLRFLEEAQVTGQLDHPGVVPVHELGVDTYGRVYFTMRLVKGEDLSKVFARVHARDPDWSLTRVLGVLLKVCEAMSYAHEKGVVHRDLKPANVMVGRHGAVYVMDWGVARIAGREDAHDLRPQDAPAGRGLPRTERSDAGDQGAAGARGPDSPLLTMDGTVLGTPFYMPPEQAAGRLADIGPHSDVYAVGAMLYHLLAGRMPYDAPGADTSPSTVLEQVKHGPPEPVHALTPDVSPELVSICEKAMAHDLHARYANMGELAEDLRAYLENRVVQAYRSGAVIELRKWVQRNKALAAMILAFVVLTVGGSSTAALVLQAKNRQVRGARDEALEAKGLADLAAASEASLRRESEEARAASESVTDFLVGQFRALEPETTRGRPVQVRELLDRAVRVLEDELGDSPLQAAKLRQVVGQAYFSLGLYDQVEPLYIKALEQRRALLGAEHPDTLGSMQDLANLWESRGRYAEAEALYSQALASSRVVLGEDHPDTLTSMSTLGALYEQQGRYEKAEELFTKSLEARRVVLAEDHPNTLTSLNNLALLYEKQGRYEEAEALHIYGLEKSRAAHGEDFPGTLTTMSNLGMLYKHQGRYVEAEALTKQALAGRRVVFGEDHPRTLLSLNNLASLYLEEERNEEAEPLLVEALTKCRTVLGEDNPTTLTVMVNLASLYNSQGLHSEAEALVEEALDVRLAILGEDHPKTLISMNNLAGIYENQGRLEEAETLYVKALERCRAVLGDDHPSTLVSMNNLALLFKDQQRYGEAEPLYTEGLQKSTAVLGRGHPATLIAMVNLAYLYESQGRFEEAEPLYRECFETSRAELGEDHSTTRKARRDLLGFLEDWLPVQRERLDADDPAPLATQRKVALLLTGTDRAGEAEALLQQCLDTRLELLGDDHTDTLESFHDLATFLAEQGRADEAEGFFQECLDQRAQVLGVDHPATLETLAGLTRLFADQGRWASAAPLARRLIELTPETSKLAADRKQLLQRIEARAGD